MVVNNFIASKIVRSFSVILTYTHGVNCYLVYIFNHGLQSREKSEYFGSSIPNFSHISITPVV